MVVHRPVEPARLLGNWLFRLFGALLARIGTCASFFMLGQSNQFRAGNGKKNLPNLPSNRSPTEMLPSGCTSTARRSNTLGPLLDAGAIFLTQFCKVENGRRTSWGLKKTRLNSPVIASIERHCLICWRRPVRQRLSFTASGTGISLSRRKLGRAFLWGEFLIRISGSRSRDSTLLK
jgi:hypothetical protein